VRRARRGWRWAAASMSVLGLSLLCAPAEAVPGTSPSVRLPTVPSWGPPTVISYGSIACRTVGACTAIGSYLDATALPHPAADTQRKGVWQAPTTIALPADAGTQTSSVGFRAIACPTQGSCLAVGSYVVTGGAALIQPMVAQESASVWGQATSAVPVPAGATMAALDAIWCTPASTCVAVGSSWKSSTSAHHAFVDTLAGGAWQPSVVLPDPSSPVLHAPVVVSPTAISCTSATECAVVGSAGGTGKHSATYGFGAIDAGGTWTTTAITPYSSTEVSLNAVSCARATSCLAVGSTGPTLTANGLLAPFSVRFASGSWRDEMILPWKFWAPLTFGGALTGVSCPQVQRCLAVGQLGGATAGTAYGSTGSFPVVYTQTDGVWTDPALASAPTSHGSVSAGAALDAIACPSKRYCEAVGTTTPRKPSALGVYPFSTIAQPFSRGTPPGGVSKVAVRVGHSRFTVRWQGPTAFGGSPIATFLVVARSPHEKVISCVTVTDICRMYRVVAHHRYTVDVTALNAARRYGPARRRLATGA
jgi:hypothetical protein